MFIICKKFWYLVSFFYFQLITNCVLQHLHLCCPHSKTNLYWNVSSFIRPLWFSFFKINYLYLLPFTVLRMGCFLKVLLSCILSKQTYFDVKCMEYFLLHVHTQNILFSTIFLDIGNLLGLSFTLLLVLETRIQEVFCFSLYK